MITRGRPRRRQRPSRWRVADAVEHGIRTSMSTTSGCEPARGAPDLAVLGLADDLEAVGRRAARRIRRAPSPGRRRSGCGCSRLTSPSAARSGSVARTAYPPSAVGAASSVPPTPAARSRIPTMPLPGSPSRLRLRRRPVRHRELEGVVRALATIAMGRPARAAGRCSSPPARSGRRRGSRGRPRRRPRRRPRERDRRRRSARRRGRAPGCRPGRAAARVALGVLGAQHAEQPPQLGEGVASLRGDVVELGDERRGHVG